MSGIVACFRRLELGAALRFQSSEALSCHYTEPLQDQSDCGSIRDIWHRRCLCPGSIAVSESTDLRNCLRNRHCKAGIKTRAIQSTSRFLYDAVNSTTSEACFFDRSGHMIIATSVPSCNDEIIALEAWEVDFFDIDRTRLKITVDIPSANRQLDNYRRWTNTEGIAVLLTGDEQYLILASLSATDGIELCFLPSARYIYDSQISCSTETRKQAQLCPIPLALMSGIAHSEAVEMFSSWDEWISESNIGFEKMTGLHCLAVKGCSTSLTIFWVGLSHVQLSKSPQSEDSAVHHELFSREFECWPFFCPDKTGKTVQITRSGSWIWLFRQPVDNRKMSDSFEFLEETECLQPTLVYEYSLDFHCLLLCCLSVDLGINLKNVHSPEGAPTISDFWEDDISESSPNVIDLPTSNDSEHQFWNIVDRNIECELSEFEMQLDRVSPCGRWIDLAVVVQLSQSNSISVTEHTQESRAIELMSIIEIFLSIDSRTCSYRIKSVHKSAPTMSPPTLLSRLQSFSIRESENGRMHTRPSNDSDFKKQDMVDNPVYPVCVTGLNS